jgi:hypothetical protein
MNHLEITEKSFTKIDGNAAALSESAGLGKNTSLAAMRESAKLPENLANQFPSAHDLLPQSIAAPRIPGVERTGEPITGQKEWPENPKPSEVFHGKNRNLQHAGELFPGIDPESVHKNQLAQRYLNSKEHLGDQPLTKEEEEELFKNPAVKKQLDGFIKNDATQPRFN